MKNNIIKVITVLNLFICLNTTAQNGIQNFNMPIKITPQVINASDTIRHTENIFNYYLHEYLKKNGIKNSYSLTFMDSLNVTNDMRKVFANSPVNCDQSTTTFIRHKEYYDRFAFYYLYDFLDKYHYLAYAEIPIHANRPSNSDENVIDNLMDFYRGGTDPNEHCGLMLYFGFDVNNNPTLAYHDESAISSDNGDMYPKGQARATLSHSYYFAEYPVIDRQLLVGDLNSNLWSHQRPTASLNLLPAQDVNIDGNGTRFLINTHYIESPIGFYHAEELKLLIEQNKNAPAPTDDTYGPCESIRIYMGYDSRPDTRFPIKLIAFAVDGRGRNIMTTFPNNDNAIMLEASWPPY